jgi:hypothetical protein
LSTLFRTTAETLKTIAADPKHLGAEIGFFAVLHSWGQNLQFHPHLHCVVAGGGPSLSGDRWVSCRPDFFLPVRVLSSLFRRLFLESLEKSFDAGKLQFFGALEPLQKRAAFTLHLAKLKARDWVVYAKAPFAGPEQVLDYVGRYTHRVAISNNRLLDIENDQVRFKWKDYRAGDQVKTMTLSAEEFIRRFLLHVLPNGFRRIRYYGFLGNRHREENLAVCRQLLGMPQIEQVEKDNTEQGAKTDYLDRYEELTGRSLRQCPQCHQGSMVVVRILPRWSASTPALMDSSRSPASLPNPRRTGAAHSAPREKCANFPTSPARVSPNWPVILLLPKTNHLSNGPRGMFHARNHPGPLYFPRGTDHSEPISRTVVERFSPTRL